MEVNNTLNYLDLSIHRTPTNLKTSIYKKPTFTDTIIPYTFNHPTQHKYTAVKFLYYRLNSYELQKEAYQQEENIIHNILYNNSFHNQPTKTLLPKTKTAANHTNTNTQVGHIHLHREGN